ncbi:hypothetical protein BDV26DRAFT_260964 [Aspergillus bertholletiae]|uniref:Uncharacterized protein n=1 Tax=Aspergillus bertholletiae TaxID=1226010 RepID=A0A5N7BAX3_9EURO|nr:hypothetical protein BDV26DRAFT_260964 [Aspergillus bertholletiae]
MQRRCSSHAAVRSHHPLSPGSVRHCKSGSTYIAIICSTKNPASNRLCKAIGSACTMACCSTGSS